MEQKGNQGKYSGLEAVGVVTDIIISIALPTTLCALGGRWLDNRFHLTPLFTIVGFLIALGVAYLLVSRQAKSIAERLKAKKQ